uniref:Cytochrome P450 94A1 n=1 Tax=Aegilops tauschii TaxID=37682 RepID=M8CVG9_AEGTA
MELSWGARCAGLAFFVLSVLVVALAAVLLLVRRWPWCSCHVCRTYLTGSWAKDFTNLGDWYAHLLRESPTGTVHIHGKRFSALLGDLLGGGIFNVDGDAWRHQRKMASLELGSVTVRSYAYKIVAHEVETRLLPVLADAADKGKFDSKFSAAADVLPDGTYVEGDSRVMYHPYAMGRMPSIWGADHEAFRPDRWLTGPGGSFAPPSLYKYPVFQAGLRVCLGKELAVTEMKAVSVAVVRAFDVEVVGENGRSGWAPRFVAGLTASISGGLPVRIKRASTSGADFK